MTQQTTRFECPKGCGLLVRTFRRNVRVLACPQCGGWATQADFDRTAAQVIAQLAREVVAAGGKLPHRWEG